MTDPAPILARLIIEIQTKANEIVEASRSPIPEAGKSDPDLNLERLIQQAEADAEIAGYCTTDKSRKVRRAALVRAGACNLLALFEMDREERDRATSGIALPGEIIESMQSNPLAKPV